MRLRFLFTVARRDGKVKVRAVFSFKMIRGITRFIIFRISGSMIPSVPSAVFASGKYFRKKSILR